MNPESELHELVDGAREVLRANDLGAWTKPAPNLYPHQWNWDSGFIAIGLSHYDSRRAQEEIRSLLRGQWHNGMVPQIVFNPQAHGYFPGPEVWQSEQSPLAPAGVTTSGITQPPILATACRAVWQHTPDRAEAQAFLREVFPHLLAYHRFFYELRNPDGDGLIVVLHPWESGLDNSPPYLEAGSRVVLSYRPTYQRLDTAHVDVAQRPTDRDYDLYVYLLEQMRADGYDPRRYLPHAPLQVQDVLFNSILCRANDDLAEIARVLGEEPAPIDQWRRETGGAINRRLWSDEDNTYFSYDRVAGMLLKDDTIAGFGPLYGRVAPPERAERLIEIRLLNPRMYHPAYPIPSTALDSPWFQPETYWRGPVWMGTNWLLIHGLVDAGRLDLAATLTRQTLALVEHAGYREYYNPFTAAGYGTDQFSWSAALTIDLALPLLSPAG